MSCFNNFNGASKLLQLNVTIGLKHLSLDISKLRLVVEHGHNCATVNATGRSRFGNEAKRGVEFRHSIHNAFIIQWKVGNGIILIRTERLNTEFPGSFCLSCCVRDTAC